VSVLRNHQTSPNGLIARHATPFHNPFGPIEIDGDGTVHPVLGEEGGDEVVSITAYAAGALDSLIMLDGNIAPIVANGGLEVLVWAVRASPCLDTRSNAVRLRQSMLFVPWYKEF
jgi:hypothetical protein